MSAIFKNQPGHPGSSFEHGVRTNVGNQVSQWVLAIAIIGSLIATLGHPFILTVLWHAWWWAVVVLYTISARYFVTQSTDVKLDQWEGKDGNDENAFMWISLWPVMLLGIVLRPDWKEARNRFVWWEGKTYIFTKNKAGPQELWSNNPVLLLWAALFRRASQYNEHVQLLQESVASAPMLLSAASLVELTEFKSSVQEAIELYNNGAIRDPQVFVNHFVQYNWKKKPLTESMKAYLIEQATATFATWKLKMKSAAVFIAAFLVLEKFFS